MPSALETVSEAPPLATSEPEPVKPDASEAPPPSSPPTQQEGDPAVRAAAPTLSSSPHKAQSHSNPRSASLTHNEQQVLTGRSASGGSISVVQPSGKVLRLGTSGTSGFRNAAPRFKDPTTITSHVDTLPSEKASTIGKGHRITFGKATDRFKVIPPATSEAETYYYNNSGLLIRKTGTTTRPQLGGSSERFATRPATTASVDFIAPKGLGDGSSASNNKASGRHSGPLGRTAPRFTSTTSVPNSSGTVCGEAMSRIDFIAPPSFTAKCQPNAPGGRVTRTANRFVDVNPVTKDTDFYLPTESSVVRMVKHVPASASLKSKTPRFQEPKNVYQGDFFTPVSFVEAILTK